ncbi:HdeD family acid-resistance protein [Marilutibacter aestuarii]|uniref:HdeD family acid-resistance protein n=1 Tax=Marilutibacter aestuarii TaxID=1706195 RepID=A0A508A751_9GAMM|nr:HdeD family acid-resistance protein [Lysobacter aestuarii]TQD45809.1 HdeD family acid-resistance protein [Lysobacter aestuarii]
MYGDNDPEASTASSAGLLQQLGRSWWLFVVYGVVAIVFGILAMMKPAAAVVALTWLFGLMALVEGILAAVALVRGGEGVSRGWQALYALASLAVGVLTLVNPLATAGVLVFFLAAWLVVGGIYRIVFAIRVRKAVRSEWMLALSGLLAIVLGALFAMNPLAGIAVTGIWIGIGALLHGALQLFAGFKLRRFAPA